MSAEEDERGNAMPPSGMLLYRQISPGKLNSDGPGKSNFLPEDHRCLSTRREAITAKGAHDAYLAEGGQSLGTWGVTVQETCDAGLEAYDDEHLDEHPPFHVTIWFPDNLSRGQQERFARQLHSYAKQRGDRGWLYGPVQG
ncbi:hypothetical protein [Mycolicibacter longobardus]|uniref:hypothetical protein n=1 Tax=Mycolicibacter longobardus TaxID=1108812 RepID=UPI001056B496|nr:hypothetical protein [Mycolicibacter longobardus]MCV7385377.1 hypothetical protein [Mycolicibacter longobardus]